MYKQSHRLLGSMPRNEKTPVFPGFLGVAEGVRTPDPQSHNLMLYPAELQPPSAGPAGNRPASLDSDSLLALPSVVNDRESALSADVT